MPTNLLSISTHQVAVVPHCTCCQNPMSLPIGIVSLIPQNAPNNPLDDMDCCKAKTSYELGQMSF